MTTAASKLLDSAFVLAAASAGLYFLGILNAEGEASALGLPRALFDRDLWTTVAYGGEGLLIYSFFLPAVSHGAVGVGWLPIVTIFLTIVSACVSVYLFRRSPHRIFWVLGAAYIGVSVHVMLASHAQMRRKVELVSLCLKQKQCDLVPLKNRVVFAKTDEQEEERIGVILTATDAFLVMLSKQGVVVIPVSRVKLIETATDA